MDTRRSTRRLALSIAVVAAAAAWIGHAMLGGGDTSGDADLSSRLAGRARVARLRAEAISHTIACERGSAIDCGIAAAMLREADPDDLPRAARLGARASASFVDERSRAPASGDDAPRRERACETGDAESCALAADLASQRGHAWRVAALHQLACDAGEPLACETALHAREAAAQGDVYAARVR